MDDPGGYLISIPFHILLSASGGDFNVPGGVVAVAVLLICSGMISASEVSFFSIKTLQLEEQVDSAAKSKLRKLLDSPKSLLATILLMNNAVNIGVIFISDDLLKNIDWQSVPSGIEIVVKVVFITFLILLFGEIIPKVYARKHSMALSLFFAFPMSLAIKVFRPLTWPLTQFSSFFDNKVKKRGRSLSVDKLSDALELTTEDETTDEDKKILKGIVEFGSLDVKAIMTPRTDAETISIDLTFKQLLAEILEYGYSRIPVYKDKEDQIEGIIYIKDILPYIHEGDDFEWSKLIREPFFVPESKKIDDLLKEFQVRKMHMALVVDEFGGFEGLVTLEDIMEEIIGEINDEYDDDDVDYHKINETNFIFAGKTSVNDFLRIIDFERNYFEEFESEPESIAGILLELSGKIPSRDETVTYQDLSFRVMNADNRRINRVKVSIMKDTAEHPSSSKNGLGLILLFLVSGFLASCGNGAELIARPKGFHEISFPKKEYQVYDSICPFTFEYPLYAGIKPFSRDASKTCWFDVVFPKYKATLHLSYENVKGNFAQYSEDQHTLAYKHTSKANAIDEIFKASPANNVYGIIYDIDGDAATNYQFHVTDSQTHFLRGSLYFDLKTNPDSVSPVLEFLKQDVDHLVETVRWK